MDMSHHDQTTFERKQTTLLQDFMEPCWIVETIWKKKKQIPVLMQWHKPLLVKLTNIMSIIVIKDKLSILPSSPIRFGEEKNWWAPPIFFHYSFFPLNLPSTSKQKKSTSFHPISFLFLSFLLFPPSQTNAMWFRHHCSLDFGGPYKIRLSTKLWFCITSWRVLTNFLS